ncbi:MAG: hypothetical protein WB795_23460 [Candidatus Acidiferrales bacterium]
MEDGAEELMKVVSGTALLEISQLPLGDRYLWRVVSALKWALVDFDDLSIVVDRKKLSPDDLDKVAALLRHRPLQFCLFLKALCGSDLRKAGSTRRAGNGESVRPLRIT